MISICIPIHEHDVRELLVQLEEQMERTERQTELVLIDDASSSAYRAVNDPLCSRHRYVTLNSNMGRSKIRNLFLEHAQYEHLLFLDCDSLLPSEDFLERYFRALDEGDADLICGGRVYRDEAPEKERLLRWRYGSFREQKALMERREAPYRSFMTNNFLVQGELLRRIPFDERLQGYGHEDTLFGYRAKQVAAEIRFIDAPVLNGHLETNAEFLHKTEEGVYNLLLIEHWLGEDPAFVSDVGLLAFYQRWKGTGLFLAMRGFFLLGGKLLRKRLISGRAGIFLFDLYKLCLLINFKRELRRTEEAVGD